MFKNPFSNFCYCIFILFFLLSISAFAQVVYPQCTGGTGVGDYATGSGCFTEQQLSFYSSSCEAQFSFISNPNPPSSCSAGNRAGSFSCRAGSTCDCPQGYTFLSGQCVFPPQCDLPNQIYNGECITPVETPQECGFTAQPVWMGSGYYCDPTFPEECPEGTIPGDYSLPGYDPRPYCADGNPPNSSSAGSASSNSGQNSSSNNSDGNGDGSGSSSGDTGNSSSASSTGDGGNSSGSASSGQGGSASSASGECDPTAKNYLECLNSKELEIPSEKGSYDDGSGTTTDDRIEELEGELQDVVDQIKSEIDSTVGVNLSGSGTLTDQCYQIMKVQVCFGWARWSQHLALIGNAIIAIAYIASFVIIMRQ